VTKRTLVQELREHSATAELNRNMLTAALTAQAADMIEELKKGFEGCCYACEPVGEMNKKLQRECDDAQVDQRLIEELWERRTEMTEMKAQIKQLTKERDEARRMASLFFVINEGGGLSNLKAKEDALSRGWDCFEETP